ncbi:MAG: prephenate dehydratase [Verrucomicrobia bacterium]|nr:prephenate dehydratase [Verrucomicrobiota bacterium]
MSLDELRKKVDALDAELVRLLNERTRVALEIGQAKEADAQEVYVPARERSILDRVAALNKGPLPPESVRSIYREVMSAALALEQKVAIAYLGPPATFTHQAARMQFGGSVDYAPCETIGEVFGFVEKRSADYGVVPIENSTDGAVTHTLDQFTDTPLKICAEIYLPISHNLLAKGPKEQIKRLYSKPEVFGQCRRWLHENMPGVELISASSTARAAETAAREVGSGALASALAADLYGLDLLEQDVQDLGGNTTRFLVIGKRYGKATGKDKTSLLFAVKHRVGALYDALSAFKQYSINMMKIESRPSKTKAWEYYFFVDVEGHADDPPVQKALANLAEHCTLMTVLGAYPKASDMDS